jgi:biotin-[acetyl-CoA-carboxylase] ligase BirA-like protein
LLQQDPPVARPDAALSPRRGRTGAAELLRSWARGAVGRPAGWRLISYRAACRELHRLGLPGRPGAPTGPIPTPFDGERLRAHFGPRLDIDLRWHCRSTLDGWRNRRLIKPVLVLSESQSGGRGRQGRCWRSPLTGNFYLSLLGPLPNRGAPGSLPLLCALAVAESLRAYGLQAGLKWPNDVLVDGRKLAGILLELDTSATPWRVAIGIGLNWYLPAGERRLIDRPSTDLHDCLAGAAALPGREDLLVDLVERLLGMLAVVRAGAAEAELERWREMDLLQGRLIAINLGGERIEGMAESIDDHGRLLLRSGERLHRLSAGEVERIRERA